MTDWLDVLTAARNEGRTVALVTVVEAQGSTPREAGAKMVVAADASHGTIGGGNLEHRAIALARQLIAADGSPLVERFSLGPSLGQCCGGAALLLIERVEPTADWLGEATSRARAGQAFGLETDLVTGAKTVIGRAPAFVSALNGMIVEPVRPPELDIVLFGAGHVGRALVAILGQLPCRVTWVDARDDQFPVEIPPNVVRCATMAPEGQVRQARPGSYFLVMTHSHSVDYELCEAILRRDDFAYLGLIGSATKRRRFEKRFVAHGIPAERLRRLTCPIGIEGVGGKHPGAVAVATAAEILRHHTAFAVAEHDIGTTARPAGAGG